MQEVSEQRKNQSGCVAKPAGCSLSLSLAPASHQQSILPRLLVLPLGFGTLLLRCKLFELADSFVSHTF